MQQVYLSLVASLNPINPNIDHYLISPHSISALNSSPIDECGDGA